MPTATRTFRVFVSSTFEDLKEERNALAAPGGPFEELKKVCQSFGARFQAIDLRWGVREEAGHDQRTMEICLGEIERCQRTGIKPNFIVLLGDRYGWRPLPAHIGAGEFEAVRERIADAKDRELVGGWYQLDENAVPPEYLLRPRTGEFKDIDCWGAVEAAMHKALREAARAAGLSGDDSIKYEASATHQEILKGLGTTPEDRKHVFAFFRQTGELEGDPDLRDLKERLTTQLKGNVHKFRAGDFEDLGQQVRNSLKEVILGEIKRFESHTPLELERKAQNVFARNRRRHFQGRQPVLDAIGGYVGEGDRRPLVLHGASGSGKSAIMARASALSKVASRSAGKVRPVMIRRFIGTTPESSNGLTLLRSICQEIARSYGGPDETPVEFNLVVGALRERLAMATAERPLHVFIDALDQFGDQDMASSLTWLPAELPEHCRVVVSRLEVTLALRGARQVEVGLLPAGEAEAALSAWLGDARRELRPQQRGKVLEYFNRCGLPLYLKLAFEEALGWRSFDAAEACVLREGLAGIIDVLFDRLSGNVNHGQLLASRSLGYLAAARYGLTEDEMLDVLSADEEVWKEFLDRARHEPPEPRLPLIVWSRLYFDLEPYLAERVVPGGTVVSFYHRQFSEGVLSRSIATDGDAGEEVRKRHEALADHFSGLGTREHGINLRKVSELPYQETLACRWEALERVLADLDFADAKINAGLLFDLIRDCERALAAHDLTSVFTVRSALRKELFSLTQKPQLALQTLYNRLLWTSSVPAALERGLQDAAGYLNRRGPWLCAEAPLPGKEGHVVFDEARPNQCVLPDLRMIAGAGFSGDVEVHDFETGETISRRSVKARGVVGIACSSDGRRVAWLENTGAIHVEGSSSFLAGRPGDQGPVWHPSAGVIAIREDNALVAWNPDTNALAVIQKDLAAPVSVLRFTTDFRTIVYVAGRQTRTVRIVMLTGEAQHIPIPVVNAPIIDVDFDPDTGLLLLLTLDSKLWVTDTRKNLHLAELSYETSPGVTVRGRPSRCAFGRNPADDVFFATDRGHVARWDTRSGSVQRLSDYCTVSDPRRLCIFERLPESGELFLSTAEMGGIWNQPPDLRPGARHESSVSACCFTRSGNVVTASLKANTISWSSPRLDQQYQLVDRTITAIARGIGLDEIIVGDHRGRLWSVGPGGTSLDRGAEAAVVFSEPVLCVFHEGGDDVVATGKSGRVVCAPLSNGVNTTVLSAFSGHREQEKIMTAGHAGEFWSLRRESQSGGQRTVFSLVRKIRGEVGVLQTGEFFADADASEDGATACIAGRSVRLFRRSGEGVDPLFRRDTAAHLVAFLGDEFLAVSVADQLWLEIWRLAEGLPTVAAIHASSPITSLAASGCNVVAGLRSGDIMSLRLRGAG
jgi:WD40 repeat protein